MRHRRVSARRDEKRDRVGRAEYLVKVLQAILSGAVLYHRAAKFMRLRGAMRNGERYGVTTRLGTRGALYMRIYDMTKLRDALLTARPELAPLLDAELARKALERL
jgi:hypothetical protein